MRKPPEIKGIVETSIYISDLDRTEEFYTQTLGLEKIARVEGRHVFFRAGSSVLLAFIAEASVKAKELPPHGATSGGHFALAIDAADVERWKEHLSSKGVSIESVQVWAGDEVSLYFRDPDGNLVEMISPKVWGL